MSIKLLVRSFITLFVSIYMFVSCTKMRTNHGASYSVKEYPTETNHMSANNAIIPQWKAQLNILSRANNKYLKGSALSLIDYKVLGTIKSFDDFKMLDTLFLSGDFFHFSEPLYNPDSLHEIIEKHPPSAQSTPYLRTHSFKRTLLKSYLQKKISGDQKILALKWRYDDHLFLTHAIATDKKGILYGRFVSYIMIKKRVNNFKKELKSTEHPQEDSAPNYDHSSFFNKCIDVNAVLTPISNIIPRDTTVNLKKLKRKDLFNNVFAEATATFNIYGFTNKKQNKKDEQYFTCVHAEAHCYNANGSCKAKLDSANVTLGKDRYIRGGSSLSLETNHLFGMHNGRIYFTLKGLGSEDKSSSVFSMSAQTWALPF